MTHCQNCGHESHCGSQLYRQETDYDSRVYSIKVCDYCRCSECQKEKVNVGNDRKNGQR